MSSLVSDALKLAGYTVLVARDGIEAERVFHRTPRQIQLVLTDVVMPRMGGPELVRRLHENYPSVRIAYMSGHAKAGLKHDSIRACDTMIQKPFSASVLKAAIRAAIGETAPISTEIGEIAPKSRSAGSHN